MSISLASGFANPKRQFLTLGALLASGVLSSAPVLAQNAEAMADPASLSVATAAGNATPSQGEPGFLDDGGLLDSDTPDLVFTVRAGATAQSPYFGSDDIEWGPSGSFRFDYVRFPNGFEYGSGNAVGFREGLGLRGSVRYIPKRNSSDHVELTGLEDVDAAFEMGLGVGYEQRNYRVYADVRYGVIGHHSFVGDLGADVILRPAEGWTLTAGPRVTLGSDRYASTYFGVTPAESVSSGLAAFDASGGAMEAGLEVSARYDFNELWGVEGILTYTKFLGDAGDSPIVQQGDDNYLKFQIGFTRQVSLDF